MLFIALLNSVKSHLTRAHLRRSFKNLNDHSLKDIGFYRDQGSIYPISGSALNDNKAKEPIPEKRIPHKDDG